MVRTKDISILDNGILAVTFEDEKGRDVKLFSRRADESAINALKVWTPKPDDVVVNIHMQEDDAERLRQWCSERELEPESFTRAVIVYMVEKWEVGK